MTDSQSCKACGVAFSEHLGVQGTCEQLHKLMRVVAEMRAMQRVYFRDGDKAILVRAKNLEKQVDRQLTDLLGVDVESMS